MPRGASSVCFFFLSVCTLAYIGNKIIPHRYQNIIKLSPLPQKNSHFFQKYLSSSYLQKCTCYYHFVLPPQSIRYMFSSFMRRGDQFSLSNASAFFEDSNSPDNLLFFVNEVELKEGIRQYDEFAFRKVSDAFEKAATLYGSKLIRPMRVFLMRVLKQNLGFIELHVDFLKLCVKFSVPRQALPILQYPGLFKHCSKSVVAEFYITGCDIYLKLRKYKEAFELIQKSSEFEFYDSELQARILQRKVILMIAMGYSISLDLKERIKSVAKKELHFTAILPSDKKKADEKQAIFNFYFGLDEYRSLKKEEELILKIDGLFEAFQDSKGANLGGYIRDNIKKNNWRIKATEVKNVDISNLEVIKGINLGGQLYRYDCQGKIMYFNHREHDQEKLNNLITKAFNMSQEVSNCRIERKEGGMGGMGRMRGMGGMGGMGGFGGMMDMMGGMMGGMGRRH